MTLHNAPDLPEQGIEQVIVPRARDLGGFDVLRVLPAATRQMVGPFIFFDQMGPAIMPAGAGVNVRPHPHIGLSTATWLFEGQICHRDSLGSQQQIVPGELNWMTAGSGIVHSERNLPEELVTPRPLFGIQSWIALPLGKEEMTPDFAHHRADELPLMTDSGTAIRLIAGRAFGAGSPVRVQSDLFYAEVRLQAGARLSVPTEHIDRAIHVALGSVIINGQSFTAGRLIVLLPGAHIVVAAETEVVFMLLGGEPLEGPRHIWWNFVSSSKERIEQAKQDWRQGKFGLVPGDEIEFIPLPAA